MLMNCNQDSRDLDFCSQLLLPIHVACRKPTKLFGANSPLRYEDAAFRFLSDANLWLRAD